MRNPNVSHNLRIELDMKNCRYSAGMLDKMETALAPLRKIVQEFPVSDLSVVVFCHQRTGMYRVKTSLVLTGRTLFTGEHDVDLYAAYHRCIRKLVNKVQAYLDSLRNKDEVTKREKGTHQEILPTQDPNLPSLDEAIHRGDYRRYREETLVYEEPLRKRIGRWIERYPEVEGLLGTELTLADLVEEVFLNSFEQYNDRPKSVRFGQWLENLIDPSIKAILRDPDGERENIDFARTASQIRLEQREQEEFPNE